MATPYRQLFNFQPQSQTANANGTDAYYNPLAGGLPPPDSPEMAALLASGAITNNSSMYGGDGAGSGDMGYTINYDKLPMANINGHQVSPATLTPTDASGSNLINPALRANDANYGDVSPTSNNKSNQMGTLDRLIYQIAPLAFMGGLTGMAGAAGALGGVGRTLLNVVPNAGQAAANRDPLGLLSSILPTLGLPNYATAAIRAATSAAQGQKPNPIGAGMSLAQIVNSVGPGG